MTSSPGTGAGPVHQRLRLATSEAHQRIEGRMPFGAPSFDVAAYRRLLGAFVGFYRPLEARLAPQAGAIAGLQWPRRVKLPLLMCDLRSLGMAQADVDALVSCSRLPSLDHPARALGCLYVLEGSTLGGQVVQRLLVERFGMAVADALSFFRSYGTEVGKHWRSFLGCLEALGPGPDAGEAERAAIETFDLLENWLQQREVLS